MAKKCEFVEKVLVACDHFGFSQAVHLFSELIRKSLTTHNSAKSFRDTLGLEKGDLNITEEEEENVWTRNSKFTNINEIQAEDLPHSLLPFLFPTIQPPARNPDPDLSAPKCSFPGCQTLFSHWEGRHHCRKCGQIFCAAHSSHFVRLPENERVEPEVGFVSSWYTYLRNFGDTKVARICDRCHLVIEEEAKCRNAFLAFGVIGLEIPLLNRAMVVTNSWRHAAQKCLGVLANVQYKHGNEKMDAFEKRMVWNNRKYFVGHSRWLMQLVRVADLERDSIAQEVYELLKVEEKVASCSAVLCNVLVDGVPCAGKVIVIVIYLFYITLTVFITLSLPLL